MRDSAMMLEAQSVSEELVTPAHYIGLSKNDKLKIKSAEIVPPKLGDKHFGKILVHYTVPFYRVRVASE